MNKHGYFQPDFNQAEIIIRRFMEVYDSLGLVLRYEARYVIEIDFFNNFKIYIFGSIMMHIFSLI